MDIQALLNGLQSLTSDALQRMDRKQLATLADALNCSAYNVLTTLGAATLHDNRACMEVITTLKQAGADNQSSLLNALRDGELLKRLGITCQSTVERCESLALSSDVVVAVQPPMLPVLFDFESLATEYQARTNARADNKVVLCDLSEYLSWD